MTQPTKLKFKGDDGEPSRKKRRQHERFTPELERDRQESLTPPRNPPKLRTDEYIFDSEEDDDFDEKLRAAMADDEGQDVWQARYNQPTSTRYAERSANGLATEQVINDQGAVLNRYLFDTMSEEDYAEHIRLGMYRRTHAAEIRRVEQMERERKAKQERARLEREAFQRKEADRIRLLEEKKRMKAVEATRAMRQNYSEKWSYLLSSKEAPLTYEHIPWPFNQQAGGKIDKPAILSFLTGHISEDRAKKAALRTAVLAYHPDRFDRYVLRIPERNGERQRVRELGLQMSQYLNELLGQYG